MISLTSYRKFSSSGHQYYHMLALHQRGSVLHIQQCTSRKMGFHVPVYTTISENICGDPDSSSSWLSKRSWIDTQRRLISDPRGSFRTEPLGILSSDWLESGPNGSDIDTMSPAFTFILHSCRYTEGIVIHMGLCLSSTHWQNVTSAQICNVARQRTTVVLVNYTQQSQHWNQWPLLVLQLISAILGGQVVGQFPSRCSKSM